MGLQRSPGPLLTHLAVGLLVLFSWMNPAHLTDLSGRYTSPVLREGPQQLRKLTVRGEGSLLSW